MTATPQEDSDHHQTDAARGQTDVSTCHFQTSSSSNHLTYGVYWRSRAGELFLGRRRRRRHVDALAHRMRHEGDISIMVSGRPDFGERKTRGEVRRVEVSNRQQTNQSDHHEKAPVGRGGGDRVVVVQGSGRARDSGTAPISSARTPLQRGRTSARAKLLPPGWKRFRFEEINELAMERNISIS